MQRLDRGEVPAFDARDLLQLRQMVAGAFAVAVAADQQRRAAAVARRSAGRGRRPQPVAAGDGGRLVAQLGRLAARFGIAEAGFGRALLWLLVAHREVSGATQAA
jgi:hypothetical protein